MSAVFDDQEASIGIRFNWNVLPSTLYEKNRLATPVGCLYTPLHERPKSKKPIPQVNDAPIRCDTCQAVMGIHADIDIDGGMWTCLFCKSKSLLSTNFSLSGEQSNGSDESGDTKDSNVVEYTLPHSISENTSSDFPYVFIYVVDLYQHADELGETSFASLIKTLQSSLEQIPEGSLFGLMTVDAQVELHNFGEDKSLFFTNDLFQSTDSESLTAHNKFDYNLLFTQNAIKKIIPEDDKLMRLAIQWERSFLFKRGFLKVLKKGSREEISSKLSSLKPRVTSSSKPDRCTGLALYIISVLLSKCSFENFMGSVSLFTGGPCTSEPGIIVDSSKRETIRTHKNIAQLDAKYLVQSLKFYNALSSIANGVGLEDIKLTNTASKRQSNFSVIESNPRWVFNIFSGSVDQVGIYEMKPLTVKTMGNVHLFENFNAYQFAKSLQYCIKVYSSNCKLRVITSDGLKVSKMLLNGFSISPSYEDLDVVGKIGDEITEFDSLSSDSLFTNQWLCNTVSPRDTFAIFFQPVPARTNGQLSNEIPKAVYIQFTFKYWDSAAKRWRLRVTTTKKSNTASKLASKSQDALKKGSNIISNLRTMMMDRELIAGFDQKCWMVLLVRLLINKIDTTLGYQRLDDLILLIDKISVRLMYQLQRVSELISNVDLSNPYLGLVDQLNENLQLLPGYIHHLRRNPNLVLIFNSSPDETAYYHAEFSKLDCPHSLTAIKPALYNLSDSTTPLPVTDMCFEAPVGSFVIMYDIYIAVIAYSNDSQTFLRLHPSDNEKMLCNHSQPIASPLQFLEETLLDPQVPPPRVIITQNGHPHSRFLVSRLDSVHDPVGLTSAHSQKSRSNGFWAIFKPSKKQKKVTYKNIPTEDITEDDYRTFLFDALRNYNVVDDV